MFSQYSWWDFAKFVLVLAVPYYAFVLWKYYREDIREWISSRGTVEKPKTEDSTVDEDDVDEDSKDLYTVRSYVEPLRASQEREPLFNDETQEEPEPTPVTPTYNSDIEIEEGVVVNEEVIAFELPVNAQPSRPSERSLAQVLNVAKRMKSTEQGALVPNDHSDSEAVDLANVINSQNGLPSVSTAFSGITFNR